MTKVNSLVKKKPRVDTSTRLAGGAGVYAARQDNLSLLRRAVMANLLWEDIAYMDGQKVADEIARLIPLCEPKAVAQIAIEARTMQKLRHTPLYIAVQMLKHKEHAKYVETILPVIITRADMLTDFVAIYEKVNGHIKPLANAAKRGLAAAFDNFNEYQFAKYDRNANIKLRDVMFLCHPKPSQGKEGLYKRIANRELKTPDTWEVALSTGKNKKETWTRLVEEGKIGGLAMLRNIRNMKDADVDRRVIAKGLETLKSSMLLPFDYLKTNRMNPEFSREIEDAMLSSYKNLPKLPGKTLFIVDVSGSMGAAMSSHSGFTRKDVAFAMAMLAVNQCEDYEIMATAGSDYLKEGKHSRIKYPEKGFGIFNQLYKESGLLGGGGIFTRQALEWAKKNLGDFDRIIVFSDSQDCDFPNKRVPAPFGKYNYICDVSNHTRGINYKGVWTAEISGFSEHFLTYIAAYEGLENKFDN